MLVYRAKCDNVFDRVNYIAYATLWRAFFQYIIDSKNKQLSIIYTCCFHKKIVNSGCGR